MLRNLLFLLFLLAGISATAQTRQLSGVVVEDSTGAAIIAATVKVKGRPGGTATNDNGRFTLTVPTGSIVLQVTSAQYTMKEVQVGESENDISIRLMLNTQQLGEVVVTALGITKNQRKLGYAVTTVDGDELNKAREVNVGNSLSGRVAGLKVTGTNSGPGGTSKLLLRGMPSMNSGGSPLIVINGVPMDNTQRGASGEWGGSDNGDGLGNLNPDDIETMTVLKGQSASALYGARATNGVILITTKTGKRNAFGVEYNLNFMADEAIDFTDWQYEYGQGTQGVRPGTATEALNSNRFSWGERLDGAQVIQFDGKTYPYSAVKDNIKDFYRTGTTLTNTIAVLGGGENGSFRFSVSDLENKSILRNSGLDRVTANLNVEQKITKRLTANVVVNYIDEKSTARPQLSDGPMNPNNFTFLATNVNNRIFEPGYNPTTGFETVFSDDIYVSNPWFVVNQYVNNLARKRWITSGAVRYNFTDWLYAQARVGYDITNDRLKKVEPWGTAYTQDQHGNLQDQASTQLFELNWDGLIGVNHNLTDDISLDAAIGGNIRKNQYEKVAVAGSNFIVPYQYTLSNTRNPRTNPNDNYDFWKTEVQSAYYTIDFSYKKFLTLSTTGRYDAYSTLPTDNNTIFTPSVSAGFIFSDLLSLDKMNFGKLRMSFAQTSGELNEAYQTALYYSLGSPLGGVPVGSFSTDLPNLFLKPFVTTEYEVGLDLRFFNSRLNLDVALYTKETKNEIMPATYSPSTGANTGKVGTGSTRNNGVEVQVIGTPFKSKDFSWVSTFNFTYVNNKILHTDPAGNNQNLGQNRATLGNAITAFVEGYPGPQILAYDYAKTEKGEMIVDAAGLPQRGLLIPMGSVLPTTYGGWNNELTYKNFNFSFLIDYNYGNKILSATKYYGLRRGLDQATLEGRDGVIKGVLSDGTPNTKAASAQDYYTALANNVTSVTVLDGDYIKLRQVTLGYSLPSNLVSSLKIFSAIQVTLVARNLAVLLKHSDNIDPEANFASNIRYAGIEGTSLPSTRSYGINLNFKFNK
ncbi:SusC/RagA family TonB-linked outer membrane protein [Flavihumibacter solisilvae]|uniref:TonB-dependent receptor n=1 Tax=Flavihumibacter solisilvae TaxID=1349421 RepID=A0A0C1L7E5_9BACT|nr:SusC/RagA family TonB-linked outer membrane protein [Flavihumibacter solisilvae]KIC95436.1 TonB-dependent receptor [Flavihumibacter solisilvae]